MGSKKSPSFHKKSRSWISSFVVFLIVLLDFITLSHNLEFRNKHSENSLNRNKAKSDLNNKGISQLLTPRYNGLIIDRPKIKVLSYRVRNTDPWAVTDELSCNPSASNRGHCDELVEPGRNNNNFKGDNSYVILGQGEDETSEWSLPPNVTQLTLECTSKSGPVEWDYEGKGIFPEIDIDNERYTGDFWTVTTYTHVSKLTIKKISDQLTGTFTCRNVEKPLVLNSFYLFIPMEKLEIFDENQKITVIPPSHSPEVVIPCRVSSRETSVYLYKKLQNGSLRKINMNNGVTYNPYVGFQLAINRDTFGQYICKVDSNSDKSLNREKREISLFMTPPAAPVVVETATSPGIQAFPTSEEMAEIASEDSTGVPQKVSEIALTNPPKVKRLKRRKKRPLMRRRGRPDPNGVFRRRGGHPHPGPGGPPPPHRRPGPPGPYMHFRRPPPPHPNMHHMPGGPYHMPPGAPSHYNRPPFSHHHPHFNQPQMIPIPVAVQPQDLEQNPNQTLNSNNSHPYFYPSPVMIPVFNEFPPSMKPIKVLPTFINKNGLKLRPPMGFSSEETFLNSAEMKNKPPSPSEDRVDQLQKQSYANKTGSSKPPRRGAAAVLSQNLLPQTMNIFSSMHCVLKKVIMGPDAPCNGSFLDTGSIRRRPGPVGTFGFGGSSEQKTILEVDVLPASENKFFPKETLLYTTVPFFVKWQTRFTDYADWAEVNHTLKEGTFKRHKAGVFEDGVNSFEVFNLVEGDSGKISVAYMGNQKEILVHTWKFFIINNTIYNSKGLTRKEEGDTNIFTCRSTSANRPNLTLTRLSDDGCPVESIEDTTKIFKSSKERMYLTEEDCGPGCTTIKTEVEFGIVHCSGDGIDEKIRFPSDVYCTGRPFFVERGKTKNLTLEENQKILILPCVINNPNADVYLFRENLNETVEEVTDNATYDLKIGFTLDLEKIEDPLGTYVCTSTSDLNDDTDMVTFNVAAAPANVFHPKSEMVYGVPPLKFVWESTEELEVENKSAGSFYTGIFAKPEGNRPHVGTFEITSLNEGESGEVKVLRSSDKSVVHTWKYKYSDKPALWLDKQRNVFRCKSSSEEIPTLFAIECSNPNVCKFKKQFMENEKSGRDNSQCGPGCAQLKIWGNKPTGFVKCKGDGIDDSLNYFLSQNNSTIITEKDNLESFKTPEITNVVRKLRIGETTNFVCKASKFFYSKGFQWAIETRNGSKRYVDLKIKDDDSFLNEIRSEISVKVADQDWKAVWCFAPLINSNEWKNVSQPIYIKL